MPQIKEMPANYIADVKDKEKFTKPITAGERLETAELISTIVDVVKSNPDLAKEEKVRLLDLVTYKDYVTFQLNNGSDFSKLEEKSVKEYGSLRKEYTGNSLPESTLEEREMVFDKVEQLIEQAYEKIQKDEKFWYTDDKSTANKIKLGLAILKEHLNNNETCKKKGWWIYDQKVFLVESLLKYDKSYKGLSDFIEKIDFQVGDEYEFGCEVTSILGQRKDRKGDGMSKAGKKRLEADIDIASEGIRGE